MKRNARMFYFLTLNWYKTKNGKNTKLRVLVIDFTQHGSEKNRVSSEKNQSGSEKSRFIFSAAVTFYCSSSPLLSVSNSLSSSFSLSQTASSLSHPVRLNAFENDFLQ